MINGTRRGWPSATATELPSLTPSLLPRRQNSRSKTPTKGRTPKGVHTGSGIDGTQDENEDTIMVESSQRPRRPHVSNELNTQFPMEYRRTTSHNNDGLKILPYNVMKSRDEVMATLLRGPNIQEYDILALQEPWRNPFTSTTHNPISHFFHLCAPARVYFFISKRIEPNRWTFTEHFDHTGNRHENPSRGRDINDPYT